MKNLKLLFKVILFYIKQIFCKHEYKWVGTSSGRNVKHDKNVVFSHHYECTKCGKDLDVNMDEGYQLELKFEYK